MYDVSLFSNSMLPCSRKSLPVILKKLPVAAGARPFLRWSQKDKTGMSKDECHPLSTSPFQDLRTRAQTIRRICRCPVCMGSNTKLSQPRLVAFDCPGCGYPTHCSEAHWRGDSEHGQYCGKLQEVNEDEHDVRRNRQMLEYELPSQFAFSSSCFFFLTVV